MRPMNTQTAKLASDMVAQQIALYDQETERLNDQIKHLEARKEAVQMMRRALLPLVAESKGQLQLVKVDLDEDKVGNGGVPLPANAAEMPLVNEIAKTIHHPTSTGFAAAVRSILRDYPKGIRPNNVAEQMKARGSSATYTGKTPFNTRVGNELHRLMKAGEVGRRSGRYYLITQEQHQ